MRLLRTSCPARPCRVCAPLPASILADSAGVDLDSCENSALWPWDLVFCPIYRSPKSELLGQRDTALAPRTIHDACRRRQSAQFQQRLPHPRPVVEVDIDNFECHGLGARSSDDDLSADGPDSLRKLYRQEGSWSQMAVGPPDSSPHVQLGDREAQVSAQIGGSRRNVL